MDPVSALIITLVLIAVGTGYALFKISKKNNISSGDNSTNVQAGRDVNIVQNDKETD